MSFVSNLASTSGSGVYGGIGPTSNASAADDVLGLVNRIKDRNMADYKNKMEYQQQLQNQQENLRQVFAPPGQLPATKGQPTTPMPNVQEKPDPNQMQNMNQVPAIQQQELGVKNKQLDVQSQRYAAQDKMAQQGLDIKSAQEKLNQQKSDQIRDQKIAELQQKHDAAVAKASVDMANLKQRADTAEKLLQFHKDVAASTREMAETKAELDRAKFESSSALQSRKIDDLEQAQKDKGLKTQTTIINKDGSKTVTSRQGTAADIVEVDGPPSPGHEDGKYRMTGDKVDHFNSTLPPGFTPPVQSPQSNNLQQNDFTSAPPPILAVNPQKPQGDDNDDGSE